MLAFCIAYGWYMLPPDEYRKLGKHIFSAGLFISNFVLNSEVGYFDTDASSKPLLHLWSLAIEEQFYLIWPVILAIGFRFNKIALLAGIGLLVSFCFNLYLVDSQPSAAFFFPQSRFWELFLGIILVDAH